MSKFGYLWWDDDGVFLWCDDLSCSWREDVTGLLPEEAVIIRAKHLAIFHIDEGNDT